MIDPAFLNELQRFSLIVNKRVTSKYSGERKSRYSGSGTIFKDRRIYAFGDNFKYIDWRVYGRTDDLYIKVFEEERNLDVHILIDASKSMQYRSKFDYAGMMALGVAFLALKNNERVRFSTFGEQAETFSGRKGMSQLMSLLTHVNSVSPSGKTDLFKSMHGYKSYIHSKSFIVIVSDFLMPLENIESALSLLRKGHTVKLIQVLDIEEKDMPLEGDFKLIDAEHKVELRTFLSRRTQQTYKERLAKHVTQVKEMCNALGFKFYQFSTETPMFDSFFTLVNE